MEAIRMEVQGERQGQRNEGGGKRRKDTACVLFSLPEALQYIT
jgi:hypothetical protein